MSNNTDLKLFGRKLNLVRSYLTGVNASQENTNKRVSQVDLAKLTLVNQCDISRMEHGLEDPKFSFIERLSIVTQVPVEYFFSGKSYSDFMRALADIDSNF
jgi:transcriptional regulator with XRE-family HTH domain